MHLIFFIVFLWYVYTYNDSKMVYELYFGSKLHERIKLYMYIFRM